MSRRAGMIQGRENGGGGGSAPIELSYTDIVYPYQGVLGKRQWASRHGIVGISKDWRIPAKNHAIRA
jgi:hypothetical protein